MPDYGHPILLGTLITPSNTSPQRTVALAQLSEEAGIHVVTFQDPENVFRGNLDLLAAAERSAPAMEVCPGRG